MVEIIPKPAKKVPLWQNILLYLSIVVLIGAVGAFFFLGYLMGESQKVLKEKEKTLAQGKTKERQELEEKILQTKAKFDNFAPLIEKHKISSEFFAFLEEIVHPQVWINKLELDIQKTEVKISGEAEKTALGQQLLIFQGNEKILKTDLSNLKTKEGEEVSFDILLSFDPGIFKFLK